MISIIQESKNTWIFISFIFTLVSSLLFLVLGYIYWPPEFNFNWIVGCICTFGMAFGCYIFSLQLRNPNPYYFSVDEEVIVIHDWGKFKPRIRTFESKKILQICYDPESGSYLKTKSGETHDIDDILMQKHREIFDLISKKFKHIQITK